MHLYFAVSFFVVVVALNDYVVELRVSPTGCRCGWTSWHVPGRVGPVWGMVPDVTPHLCSCSGACPIQVGHLFLYQFLIIFFALLTLRCLFLNFFSFFFSFCVGIFVPLFFLSSWSPFSCPVDMYFFFLKLKNQKHSWLPTSWDKTKMHKRLKRLNFFPSN